MHSPVGVLYSWSALLWGLQAAFLAPVLALLLVTLYGATPADIGWVLSIYNAAGFVATILIPAWADRHRNYLRPMLICAALTVALAGTLALATSLPMAVVALVALGAPGSVGSTLLFAELRHSGVGVAVLMQTRAIVSVAWVAGPPLATLIMGVAGNRSILPVLAGLGVLNVVGTLAMASARRRPFDDAAPETSFEAGGLRIGKVALVAIVAGTGLSVFQDSIPKPGLATGLNMNTRRIGAIISGPIIAIASVESLGFPGIFAVCAGLTVVALVILLIAQPRSAAH